MSIIVKLGKQAKKILRKVAPPPAPCLSYTRRIERICTQKRLAAMTFDDGPMDLPASPDKFGGKALTDVLLDTLEEYGAKGTFDVVGDTSENYPDQAGALGSAAWGGIQYDHYPDIHQDSHGGVVHNDRLVQRILTGGHQITNHGYRHIIFGKKPFVYGKRKFLGSFDLAAQDLSRLHDLMRDRYGYELKFTRPAHYVDPIGDGFTAYDVCDRMNYQYMAASFDGAGWLPSMLSDPEAALKAEVDAMLDPMQKALEANPNALCGQIIFQKDGYNMAKRTPVAWGLGLQLKLLKEYGYQVVTVEELLEESPFADLGREDPDFALMRDLSEARAVVYSDNCLRLDAPMTWGELAMLVTPKEEALGRRWEKIRNTGKRQHPYCGAMEYAKEHGLIPADALRSAAVTELPEKQFRKIEGRSRREIYRAWRA